MESRWSQVQEIRRRQARESGLPFQVGTRTVALLYPSPYRVGMSSLGYQWIGHLLAEAGFGVERFFLPEGDGGQVLGEETGASLGDFGLVAVSVAWELEIAGLVRALQGAGIPALRERRGPEHPCILLGGPLTFSNPRPLAPFGDALLLGEADASVVPAVRGFFGAERTGWLDGMAGLPGGWVPERAPEPPAPAVASSDLLPARSRIMTPESELSDMFLVEGERGCSRSCRFCVMRKDAEGAGMRVVPAARVLAAIPDEARKVGLVGAAIGDHPELREILATLVSQGRGVGMSSLRADRVADCPWIVEYLVKAGSRSLAVASDAASERLRHQLGKGVTEEHLLECARIATQVGLGPLKLYTMLGVPGEDDGDVEELVACCQRMAALHPLVLAISPFVPKLRTPLSEAPFAGLTTLGRRLAHLQTRVGRVVELRAVSPRWAWVEYRLAQGDAHVGAAVVGAVEHGGGFQAYRKAFEGVDGRSA
jgi:radical SAM superfamily enzyme YgiQ (UPF0313 family)